MRRRSHLALLGLLAACCLPLLACSDSGSGDATPTTAPATAPVDGLCALITEQDLTALFGTGVKFGTPDTTGSSCNWRVETLNGSNQGRIYLGGSGIPYSKTIADSQQLGQDMVDIEGLGASAHFTTHDIDDLYWITIENGSGTLSVAAEYTNGGTPPPQEDLIAALTQLATVYLAGI